MLVIISDLHLLDNKVRTSIRNRAFRIFRQRLSDAAYDASRRSGGKYVPIKKVDLVLLGDILDVIRSAKWPLREKSEKRDLKKCVRPWDDSESPEFINTVKDITAGILKTNEKGLETLRKLRKDGIDIPGQDGDKPSESARITVPVNIYYMVGNHDWFYHLPGEAYDKIRRSIIQKLGLAHEDTGPFPYYQSENDKLNKLVEDHNAYIHHGDKYDNFNFSGNRDKSSFGDAVVVELVNSFYDLAHKDMADSLPAEFVKGLREIDNVRPLSMIPRWIESLIIEYDLNAQQTAIVHREWKRLIKNFTKSRFVKSFKSSDAKVLRRVFFFSGLISFKKLVWIRSKLSWLLNMDTGESPNWENALNEKPIISAESRFVVYGHTHHPLIEVLDRRIIEGDLSPQSQVYINSGTWRQAHLPTKKKSLQLKFGGYKMMTYVTFFKGNEHRGQKYGTWTGNLDSN